MITNIVDYVNYYYKQLRIQPQFINTDKAVLKSALVYQYLFNKHFHKSISVEEILQFNNYDTDDIEHQHILINEIYDGLYVE